MYWVIEKRKKKGERLNRFFFLYGKEGIYPIKLIAPDLINIVSNLHALRITSLILAQHTYSDSFL